MATAETSAIESLAEISVETSATDLPTTETSIIETSSTEISTIEVLPTESSTPETSTTETSTTEATTAEASNVETSIIEPPIIEPTTSEDAITTLAPNTISEVLDATTTASAEPAAQTLTLFRLVTSSGKYVQVSDSTTTYANLQSSGGSTLTIPAGTYHLETQSGQRLCAAYTQDNAANIVVCPVSLGITRGYLSCSQAGDKTVSCSVTGKICGGLSCSTTNAPFDTFYGDSSGVTNSLWIGVPSGVNGGASLVLTAWAPVATE